MNIRFISDVTYHLLSRCIAFCIIPRNPKRPVLGISEHECRWIVGYHSRSTNRSAKIPRLEPPAVVLFG